MSIVLLGAPVLFYVSIVFMGAHRATTMCLWSPSVLDFPAYIGLHMCETPCDTQRRIRFPSRYKCIKKMYIHIYINVTGCPSTHKPFRNVRTFSYLYWHGAGMRPVKCEHGNRARRNTRMQTHVHGEAQTRRILEQDARNI